MATKAPDVGRVFRRLEVNNNTIAQTPSTQRKYTPYTKFNQRSRAFTRTPLPTQRPKPSRRVEELKTLDQPHQRSRTISRTKNTTKEGSEGLSSQIVGKTWRVYRASPFYRLKSDKKSFKSYERHLNSWLTVESCTTIHTSKSRKTSFRKVEGDSADEFGIEIKVFSNDGKEKKEKNNPELIAVLISERKSEEFEKIPGESELGNTDEVISFPVCLIKSTVLVKERFLEWLEAQFGCKISLLCFPPCYLAWLVSLCSGIGQPSHSTELTYQVPAVVEGLDTICFNIAAQDARKIWNSIHNPCKEFFTDQEAMKFLKSLECHFYHHFKINLDQMQLATVGTSVAYIGREGQLKILQKGFVCYILQQLVQFAKF